MTENTSWEVVRDLLKLEDVEQFTQDVWQGDAGTLTHISSGINGIYRFESNGEGQYLRIFHPNVRKLWKNEAALDYLIHLSRSGVPVCHPVLSTTGEYTVQLPTEISPNGQPLYACTVTEAPGAVINPKSADETILEAWGTALGKLHAAARTYTPSDGIQSMNVQQFMENVRPYAESAEPKIYAAYKEIVAWMESLPKTDYGITHGDYRAGNVTWDGQKVTNIDFDEPNYHWFIADMARVMIEFYDRPLEERRHFRDAFLRGYLPENPIDQRWIDELGTFMQARVLLMNLWDMMGVPFDPESDDAVEFDRISAGLMFHPAEW